MGIFVISAVAKDGAIGQTRDGVPGLPWPRLTTDMRLFRALTCSNDPRYVAEVICTEPMLWDVREPISAEGPQNAVILGHRAYASLGSKPLPYRQTIVLRDQTSHGAGDWPCKARSLTEALEKAQALGCPHVFLAGGQRVYSEGMRRQDIDALFLTEIASAYPEADTFFPRRSALDWEAGLFAWPCDHPWHRTACSPWITEPERPRYRLGVWERG